MSKVLLIGDVMLDVNTHGTCTRISPEAPVQVVKRTKEVQTLGGAGNNLVNLFHLNVETDFIIVIGNDRCGEVIEEMAKIHSKNAVIFKEERSSTVKNRILAHGHQVLRIDDEDTHAISKTTRNDILNYVKNNIKKYDVVLISDYNKGVCTQELIKEVVDISSKNNVKVVCDPKKGNIEIYDGCYIITPNKSEAETIYGKKITNDEDVHNALLYMKKYITKPVITLSEKGIAYLGNEDELRISHAHAQDVVDVTGAGDTVVSTICYCLTKGFDMEHSIELANKAAAIVVTKLGTSYVTEKEINQSNSKVLRSFEDLPNLHGKVVFTNGCFDILHAGHVRYLNEAKRLGDILIVGLNSDDSIKRLKGSERPLNNLEARAEVLAGLASVDYIIPFTEDTPYNLIKAIKPDVLVKGGDYNPKDIVGNDVAKETVVIPFVDGFSTTGLVKKIKG